MSDKKKRSMAGLPWIAAMAFFMQALDATILNTALPAIAHSLNRSPLAMQSAIISYTLTVGDAYSVSGWLSRSLRYASPFYPCRESVHVGFSGLRTFQLATTAGCLPGYSGDRRRNDDACCSAGLTARLSS